MPSGGQNCLQVRTTVLERQGGEREGRRRRRKKRRKNTKEKEKKKKKNLPWVWDLQGKNHDHIWYSSLHIIGAKYLPIDWLTGNEELFGKGESPRLVWTDSPSACLCLRYALLSWAVRTACRGRLSTHLMVAVRPHSWVRRADPLPAAGTARAVGRCQEGPGCKLSLKFRTRRVRPSFFPCLHLSSFLMKETGGVS